MNKNHLLHISLIVIGMLVGTLGYRYWNQQQLKQRQAEIQAKGSEVMPFDLNAATHVFQKTADGGLQQVRIKNSNDTQQISLIQSHLKEEAERFSRGDFSDPAQLHGSNMPGLAILTNSADKLTVEYQDLEDGAQIIYKTDDEEVMQAIHDWFMAQLGDHGNDAVDHSQMML